jgi:predicted HAD superfamily Cof-like phosphohydrolase
MTDWTQHLIDFHRKFGHHIRPKPELPPSHVAILRANLIREEFEELMEAIVNGDIPAIAKEGCDLIYVVVGTLLAYGINPRIVFFAVHMSNMSKSQSKRGDGKTDKGDSYVPPDISAVLSQQRPMWDDMVDYDAHERSGIPDGEAR